MSRFTLRTLPLAVGPLLLFAHLGTAQTARTRSSASGDAPPAQSGIPRDPKFPYAGLWKGTRTMAIGNDQISFRFSVTDGKYQGVMLAGGGGTIPQGKMSATSAGLSWEQPNSGGGTWVYQVRLVAPDSMVGTLVLRDPPSNFPLPAPKGTLVLVRQPAGSSHLR